MLKTINIDNIGIIEVLLKSGKTISISIMENELGDIEIYHIISKKVKKVYNVTTPRNK